jgi:preprotein translocase subunit SecY
MSVINSIAKFIPEVIAPTQKKLGFNEKLKWTAIILVFYFILGVIPLYGVSVSALSRFANLAVILGAKFGSIISLGIGPIVTASIVLQLLNGAGILKFETSTDEGRKEFQSAQKVLTYGFILFEAIIYVIAGGLAPDPALAGQSIYVTLQILIIAQLIIGAVLITLMDDVTQKWGFGSGVSLFIAAGVSQELFVRFFSFVKPAGYDYSAGAFFAIFQALGAGEMEVVVLMASGIFFTLLVIGIAIYIQSMKVEIPLSVGRIRGHARPWPLNFLYTSNIPVILIAALLANIQIGAQFLSRAFPKIDPMAIQAWVSGPSIIPLIIENKSFAIGLTPYLQVLVYLTIFMVGSVVFSWFWVQTSGMDAYSQAKKMAASGLSIPGFRSDPRILEHRLNTYIPQLTIMGAIAVAFIAVFADISGAFSSGTGVLLVVMILYKMYEDIAKQHLADMDPTLREFVGGI